MQGGNVKQIRINKFDLGMRVKCIELAGEGYLDYEIADLVGVNRSTLHRWKKQDRKFEETLIDVRSRAFTHLATKSIRDLARGASKEERSEEFSERRYKYNEDGSPKLDYEGDHEYDMIKVRTKVTKNSPDINAIKMLAKVHAKEYSDSENEATTNILNINTSGMTLRELRDMTSKSILGDIEDCSDIVADYNEVESTIEDFEELEVDNSKDSDL